ncbi:PD-(D/E)XK nuclease family protein [uncultured Salegentibacter sp.]|uniref:PD-(D/E)XK nuclease family protein n=1 Tax=uncultured Salegentibacter sp. TaxID=259320 RepID=UPI00259A3523|nr:PD-(D/E)XK nuclease family protein [uncultured Salegentibacter sp.]
MKLKPNIFNFATSELSQDAFLAWLLCWANPDYANADNDLHLLGLSFLKSLLAKQKIQLTNVSNLEVKTQFHKIDVFVSFEMNGKKYGIIIEDKVYTSNHSNQLTTYKNKIENKDFDVVVPIYLKTGFQHCYKDVQSKGFYPYSVKELITVLKAGQHIDNAILNNYYEYILSKEKEFDNAKYAYVNYKTILVSNWKWWECTGFFNEYSNSFSAGWGSVGNNRQPLLAMWCKGAPLNIKDADTGANLKLDLYLDVIYATNSLNINFRLGNLEAHPQTNNRNRNKIYNAFSSVLNKEGIIHRKPHFRKSKQTLCLAQVTDVDMNIKYDKFLALITDYKEVANQFAINYTDA